MTFLQWEALAVSLLLLLYFAVELAWGGGDRNSKEHNPIDPYNGF
jgi:hypothetical protein